MSCRIGALGVAEKLSRLAVRLARTIDLDSGTPNPGAGIIRAGIEHTGRRPLG